MGKLQKSVVGILLSLLFIITTISPAVLAAPSQPASPLEDPLGNDQESRAEPQDLTLAEKQEKARKIQQEIDALDINIETIIESYNLEKLKLQETQAKLKDAENLFDEINTRYVARQDVYEKRIVEIYKSGNSSIVEVVLNTQSFNDFISRIRFLALLAEQDSSLVDALAQERNMLREARDQLEQFEIEQQEIMQGLQKKKVEIETKMNEKKMLLESVDVEIQAIINADLAKKAKESKAIYQKLLLEAQMPGSVFAAMIDPTSPIYTAMQYLGVPYLWGGKDPDKGGLDCSGLTFYVFKQHGVVLPHYSGWQYQQGNPVGKDELIPGDLVFFGNPIHHVGIFIGKSYMIHAPRTGDVVKISDFSNRKDFTGARRFPLLPKE